VLQAIGKEITTQVKPKAIVVFSAHWQCEKNAVEVNTAEDTDMIFEYVHGDYAYWLQLNWDL